MRQYGARKCDNTKLGKMTIWSEEMGQYRAKKCNNIELGNAII